MGNGKMVNLENIGLVDQGVLDKRPVKTVIDEGSFRDKQNGKFDGEINTRARIFEIMATQHKMGIIIFFLKNRKHVKRLSNNGITDYYNQ